MHRHLQYTYENLTTLGSELSIYGIIIKIDRVFRRELSCTRCSASQSSTELLVSQGRLL